MRVSVAMTAMIILAGAPRTSAAQASAIEALKPLIRARVTCSIQAAGRFSLPASLVIAVAEQEGGRIGQWVKNANGSYDVGPMQFNTSYLQSLERFGITSNDVQGEGCFPYELAAWRLRHHLDHDSGDVWRRAANYHSRTPIHNLRYQTAIRVRAAKWARWLSAHAPVIATAPLAAPPTPNPPPAPPEGSGMISFAQTALPKRRAVRNNQHHFARSRGRTKPDNITAPRQSLVETLAAIDASRHMKLLRIVRSPPGETAQRSLTSAVTFEADRRQDALEQTTMRP